MKNDFQNYRDFTYKHLRGRHDQRDHAWNRGTGRGVTTTGGASALSSEQYQLAQQNLRKLVASGEISKNEMRYRLQRMRTAIGNSSRRNLFMQGRRAGTETQGDLTKSIKAFQQKRNKERLPYKFDPTPFETEMTTVDEGASGVQRFEIDGKSHFYRKNPIFAGSRNRGEADVAETVRDYWFSMPSYYMPLIADSLSGAMGVEIAPIAQMSNNNRVIANEIGFDKDTGVETYLNSLLDNYNKNPTQENYDEYVNTIEPMLVMNIITGNVDAKYDNMRMIDKQEGSTVGGKKMLMSFDYDYSGSNPKYTGKYFEDNDVLKRYTQFKSAHARPGEKFLSPQMEAVLREMPNTIEWNDAIPDFARQQIMNRVENLLRINDSMDVSQMRSRDISDGVVETMQRDSKDELNQRKDAEKIRNSMIYLQSNVNKLMDGQKYLKINYDKAIAFVGKNEADNIVRNILGGNVDTLMQDAKNLQQQILALTNQVFDNYDATQYANIQQQIQSLYAMISASPLIRRSRDLSRYMEQYDFGMKGKSVNNNVFEKIEELRMKSIHRRLDNVSYKQPINYGAAVGEVISGQLGRGAGGRFANAAELRKISQSNNPLSLFRGNKKRMFQTIFNSITRPTPLTNMLNKSQSLVADMLNKKNGQWDEEVQKMQQASDELWRLETGFKRNLITGDNGIKPTGVSVRIEGLNSDKTGEGQTVAEMIPGLNNGEPAESYAQGIGKRMAQDAYDYLSVFNQRGDLAKFNGKQPEFNLTRLPEGQKFRINEEALKNGEIKIDFNFDAKNPKGPTRDEINDALSDVMMKMDPNIEKFAQKFMSQNPNFAVGAEGQPKDLLQQAMASLLADPQKMANEHPELMKFVISSAHGVDLFDDANAQSVTSQIATPSAQPSKPEQSNTGRDWSDTDPGLQQKRPSAASPTQSSAPSPAQPVSSTPEYISNNAGGFDADPNDQFANYAAMRDRFPATESALPQGQTPPPGFIRAGYVSGPTGQYGASGLNPNDTWYNPQTGETWKPSADAINRAVANSGVEPSRATQPNRSENVSPTSTPQPTPTARSTTPSPSPSATSGRNTSTTASPTPAGQPTNTARQSLNRKMSTFGMQNIIRAFNSNPERAAKVYNLSSEEVRELENMLPNMQP